MVGNTSDAESNDIAAVLGRLPSGLSILTAKSVDGRETGMLASWVQQAAFEPPMLTVAVNIKRYVHQWLAGSSAVGLSLLGEQQKDLLKHFSAGFEPDAPAFTGIDVTYGALGVPLLSAALATIEGRISSQITTGDHIVYAIKILNASRGPEFATQQPWVHLRKNGLRY